MKAVGNRRLSFKMEFDEQIKIQTDYGELIGYFVSSPISEIENVYTAWFKEFPITVQADTIEESIEQLKITLEVMLKYNLSKELALK